MLSSASELIGDIKIEGSMNCSNHILVEFKVLSDIGKLRRVSWEEYMDAAQLCRDEVRKAKVRMELNLARGVKNNKKGFYRYVNQKRKIKV